MREQEVEFGSVEQVIKYDDLAGHLASGKDFIVELGEQKGIGSSSLLIHKCDKRDLLIVEPLLRAPESIRPQLIRLVEIWMKSILTGQFSPMSTGTISH